MRFPRRSTEPQRDLLEQLYDRHGAIVYARCRRTLGDAIMAEDATQETFLRVHRARGALPDEAALLPWLYRIATNVCLNIMRDGRARRVLREVPPERAGADAAELMAERDLAARLILRASPKLQITAWLFHVDGMYQEEIAEVLGISRRMVAKRLAQFVRQSRKFLRLDRR